MKNETKKAKNKDAAWDLQETYKNKTSGWIQWKGTNVCMDVHCAKCGHHSHLDIDFAYHVICPKCKTVYFCNGHIEMIELEEKPDSCVVMETALGDSERVEDWDDERWKDQDEQFKLTDDNEEFDALSGAEQSRIRQNLRNKNA